MQTQCDAEVSIDLLPNGRAKIVVDGVDISRIVHKIHIDMTANYIAQVVLHCRNVKTEVRGIADAIRIGENSDQPETDERIPAIRPSESLLEMHRLR